MTFKRDQLSWKGHDTLFEEIISKYDFLKDKKIIVMSMNYQGGNFNDFPNNISLKLSNKHESKLVWSSVGQNQIDVYSNLN